MFPDAHNPGRGHQSGRRRQSPLSLGQTRQSLASLTESSVLHLGTSLGGLEALQQIANARTQRYNGHARQYGAFLSRAQQHYFAGNLEDAVPEAQQAIRCGELMLKLFPTENRPTIAMSYETLGNTLSELNDFRGAEAALNRAIAIFVQAETTGKELANLFRAYGKVAFKLGNYEYAINSHAQALQLMSPLGPEHRLDRMSEHLRLGVAYACHGERSPAQEHTQRAFELLGELDHEKPATLIGQLWQFSFDLGSTVAGLYSPPRPVFSFCQPILTEARERCRSLPKDNDGSIRLTVHVLHQLGYVYSDDGKHGLAADVLEEAIALAEQTNMEPHTLADIHCCACCAYRNIPEGQTDALRHIKHAREVLSSAESTEIHSQFIILWNQVHSMFTLGQREGAEMLMEEVLALIDREIPEEEGPFLLARANEAVSELIEFQNFELANRLYDLAHGICQGLCPTFWEYIADNQFVGGRLAEVQHDPQRALEHYQAAISVLNQHGTEPTNEKVKHVQIHRQAAYEALGEHAQGDRSISEYRDELKALTEDAAATVLYHRLGLTLAERQVSGLRDRAAHESLDSVDLKQTGEELSAVLDGYVRGLSHLNWANYAEGLEVAREAYARLMEVTYREGQWTSLVYPTHDLLGQLLVVTDQLDEANEVFQTMMNIGDTLSSEAWHSINRLRAAIAIATGEAESLIEDIGAVAEKAPRLVTNSAISNGILARAHLAIGNESEAVRHLTDSRDILLSWNQGLCFVWKDLFEVAASLDGAVPNDLRQQLTDDRDRFRSALMAHNDESFARAYLGDLY